MYAPDNNNRIVRSEAAKNLIRDHLLLMASQRVWFPDPQHGFLLGQIIDLGADKVTIVPEKKSSQQICVEYEFVFPAEDNNVTDYDDNCSLMYLNEATLLNNVRLRYSRGMIYTYIANMLIAVNPYVEIKGLYSPETIKRYQGKSLGTLPPHVYAIGDKSFRDMKVTKQSQSIIVSGESGAGKTESTKYILRYLCGSDGTAAGPIEQKILDANPVLEAFGNAKTTRNNNSSRFGKFIEIHFESNQKVTGGFISHYLLEKSRIVCQSKEERNYHIFYQLLSCSDTALKTSLNINKSIEHFHYLNQGCREFFGESLKDPIVNDQADFKKLESSLKRLGLTKEDIHKIYHVIATVLNVGNVEFEDDADNRGGCRVANEEALKIVASMMSIDLEELRICLTSRVMQAAKGGHKGTVIMVPLKLYECRNARDALAKAMYSRVFDHIVHRINMSIPFKSSATYIGVLDIAGFEFFPLNSFEQFCINYCNEKLQQFFNERVLSDEQNLYEKEGLGLERIQFIDNSDCIDLIESRNGVISILDEESKLPKPTNTNFTSQVHKNFGTHFRLAVPRKSKIKEHRELRDEEGFLIRHFAGAVCYQTTQFIEKNNDALHTSLEALVQESKNAFLQGLFQPGNGNQAQQKGKLSYVSVASKFRVQLSELLEKLRGTGTSFIRCIKPNAKMIHDVFEGGQILSQLQSAGMTSVLELMQKGYPSRVHFSSLYATYKTFLPPKLQALDPRFFCRALFKALGLSEDDFRFGLTKVFFRPGKFKEFDQIMRSDPESLAQMVRSVARWIIQNKWKKTAYTAVCAIKLQKKIIYRRENLLIIQKTVKMHLTRKRHRPRYRGILKLKQLNAQIDGMSETAKKLKKQKDVSVADVKKLQDQLRAAVDQIKKNERVTEAEIEKSYKDLLKTSDALLKTLTTRIQSEKNAEEQEKARLMREQLEKQKREKELQEEQLRQDKENKRLKAEIEERRKIEEAEENKKKQQVARIMSPEKTKKDNENEQERRDNEIAYRLAQESGVGLEEVAKTPDLKRSNFVVNNLKNKKFDLSGWKYSELRDAINTSCDVELLEACREEFHRRLKVYHAWKSRNNKSAKSEMDERAPKSIYQHQASHQPTPSPTPPSGTAPAQRYFRIPFMKDGQNKGLWYAHFDGPYIARQMETHSGREPVLLIAGRDDMQMCELKLNETGLTRKRGAEILEYEFTKEWEKNAGEPYIRPAERAATRN